MLSGLRRGLYFTTGMAIIPRYSQTTLPTSSNPVCKPVVELDDDCNLKGIKCSACGDDMPLECLYCPNCGARVVNADE